MNYLILCSVLLALIERPTQYNNSFKEQNASIKVKISHLEDGFHWISENKNAGTVNLIESKKNIDYPVERKVFIRKNQIESVEMGTDYYNHRENDILIFTFNSEAATALAAVKSNPLNKLQLCLILNDKITLVAQFILPFSGKNKMTFSSALHSRDDLQKIKMAVESHN